MVGSPAVGEQRAPTRCEARKLRPAACRRTQREQPLASACALGREQVHVGPGRRVSARAVECRPAAWARTTVDVDGVVVDLKPSRRRRYVRRPLPSDAGSSPKDTRLSEQIRASKHSLPGQHPGTSWLQT